MGLFNATLVMVSYLFISFRGCPGKRKLFILGRVNMQGAIIDTACTISFEIKSKPLTWVCYPCLNLFIMEQAAAGFSQLN